MAGTLELLKSVSLDLSYDELSTETKFEARLYRNSRNFPATYELDLQLWIKFTQINPSGGNFWTLDADGNPFFIRPWKSKDWNNFIDAASQQADLWNNKFWLKPPNSVTELDIFDMNNGLWMRPYIKCTLTTYFGEVPGSFGRRSPHRVVEVANVDPSKYLNPGSFRSHALLYSENDATPKVFTVPDNLKVNHTFTQPTMTHEIGHALGLQHIGVLRKTAFCKVAELNDHAGNPLQNTLFGGGWNAAYCYGYSENADMADNIMGYGQKFSADDAKPWNWSAMTMFGPGFWTIMTAYPGDSFSAVERNRIR